jgi:hypothetical protein
LAVTPAVVMTTTEWSPAKRFVSGPVLAAHI